MPKKNKKKLSLKDAGNSIDTGPTGPSDKEKELQRELDELQNKLERLKVEAEKLRKDNEFLQQEAVQTRTESNEYMAFMAKKTNKRQSAIITLSDQNEYELRKIELEKAEMLKNYEDRKTELNESLMQKERRLSKATDAYDDLKHYQTLRNGQLEKIKQLEHQLIDKRSEYAETLQKMKTNFLSERARYANESEEQVRKLIKEANKRATVCLGEHADGIKEENKNLRAELAELLKKSSLLNDHKQSLEKQHVELMREQEYSKDILRLRGEKQLRAIAKQDEAAEKKNVKKQEPKEKLAAAAEHAV